MLSFGVTLSLSLALGVGQAGQAPRWGEPEIIGANETQRAVVRAVLADLQGEIDLKTIEEQARQRCKTIKKEILGLKAAQINCSIVQMQQNSVHVVVDVVQHGEEERIRFPSRKWSDITFDGSRGGDFAKRMVRCALECGDENHRASAFKELQNIPSTESTCYTAYRGLNDPSVLARNYAAQYLNYFAAPCVSSLGAARLLVELGTLIQRPNHSDRNKGIATIQLIATSSNLDAPCELLAIRNSMVALAAESVLSNVGGIAKKVIEIMDDRPEEFRLDCEKMGVANNH